MNVYMLTFESNNFQSLIPEDSSIWKLDVLTFNGRPKSDSWKPPKFRVYDPMRERGDFFGAGPGTLGIGVDAQEKLLNLLERSGELLEIEPKHLEICLLNITECVDCLDHEHVSWIYGEETGKPIRITKYSFKKEMIPETPLFKIPELVKAKILTHDGFDEDEDSFIDMVKKYQLKGLRFEKIWSDE